MNWLFLLASWSVLCVCTCSGIGGGNVPQPETDNLVKTYFHLGKTYNIILAYLLARHGIHVSLSWLKRRLCVLGLRRKGVAERPADIAAARTAIRIELQSANSGLGYRSMWLLLKMKYKIFVKRETVRKLLQQLDSSAVSQRRRRRLKRRKYLNLGPNFVWHADGYDKLSRFGLTIHGCIDGFSRQIIWMKLSPTNHDPKVIVTYYMQAVAEYGGCPTVMRCDYGTENCLLAATQMALRHGHGDTWAGLKSFKYGKSTSNTRIEGLWSHLRKWKTSWWIHKFQDMIQSGLLNPQNVDHKYSLAYVYAELLHQDVVEFVQLWNHHRICSNRLANCPSGIPDDIFKLPHQYGTRDYLCTPLDVDVYREAAQNFCRANPPFYPAEFSRLADAVLVQELSMVHSDITHANCDHVFCTLITFLNTH